VERLLPAAAFRHRDPRRLGGHVDDVPEPIAEDVVQHATGCPPGHLPQQGGHPAQHGRLPRGVVQGLLQDEVDQIDRRPLRHDQAHDAVVVGTTVRREPSGDQVAQQGRGVGQRVHCGRRVVDPRGQGADGDVDDLARAVGDVACGAALEARSHRLPEGLLQRRAVRFPTPPRGQACATGVPVTTESPIRAASRTTTSEVTAAETRRSSSTSTTNPA
jgi:hypothetical protein